MDNSLHDISIVWVFNLHFDTFTILHFDIVFCLARLGFFKLFGVTFLIGLWLR
jgi:hypothetical protein